MAVWSLGPVRDCLWLQAARGQVRGQREPSWASASHSAHAGLSSPDPRGLWGAVGAAVPDAQPGQREQEGEKTRPMGVAVARLGLRGGPGVLSEGIKL